MSKEFTLVNKRVTFTSLTEDFNRMKEHLPGNEYASPIHFKTAIAALQKFNSLNLTETLPQKRVIFSEALDYAQYIIEQLANIKKLENELNKSFKTDADNQYSKQLAAQEEAIKNKLRQLPEKKSLRWALDQDKTKIFTNRRNSTGSMAINQKPNQHNPYI